MALIRNISTVYCRSKSLLHTGSRMLGSVIGFKLSSTMTDTSTTEISKKISSEEINKKLMEFFDDEKNWGANDVKVGRAWKKDELRIKSNVDLHKLWYVLLKERNMLLSMEHESREQMRLFPNPERLDKVKESMTNLEEVVRERNKAYFMLETGEDGERPERLAVNPFGITYTYRMQEHAIKMHKNLKWWKGLEVGYEKNPSVKRFLRLYREKLSLEKKRQRTRNVNHVQHLLQRFPNMDLEAVREQYPDVNIEKARTAKRARGNHEFNS